MRIDQNIYILMTTRQWYKYYVKMELEEKINQTIEELKRTPQQIEDWKKLQAKLKKMEFYWTDCTIHKIDPTEAKKILDVLEKLETLYGYKTMKPIISASEHTSFDNLLELAELKGDVIDMLETLHKADHKLGGHGTLEEHLKDKARVILNKKNVAEFKELIKDNLYKKYSKTLTVLQEELGLSTKNGWAYRKEIDDIIELSKTEGDICGVIYLLASKGYHIGSPGTITEKDVKSIKEITETILKEGRDMAITVCTDLYKREDNERFKKYFQSLKDNKKKYVIISLFKLEEDNKEIQNWLEHSYTPLLREAGLQE